MFNGNLDHTSILQLLADRFNPGQDYSAAVGARQPQLVRLATILSDRLPARPLGLPVPSATAAAVSAAAAGAAVLATGPRTAGATANAKAFQNVAVKVAREHPDLLTHPGWGALARYVRSVQQSP